MKRVRAAFFLQFLIVMPLLAGPPQSGKRPIELADILKWQSVRGAVLSNDGQWFAYQVAPVEGDSELILKNVKSGKETRFAIGEAPRRRFSRGGERSNANEPVAFSEDSKWLGFTVYPTRKEAAKLKQQKKPARNKVTLVNLATGEKVEYDKVKAFAFAGEKASWMALHKYAAESQPKPKWSGSDLILRRLEDGSQLNLGNVSEFSFNKSGDWLALTIDAEDKIGNGIEIMNTAGGAVVPLDSGKAVYKKINWTEKGDAVAILKGTEDKDYENERYEVLGFRALSGAGPEKIVYQPTGDESFPSDMTVSPNRAPEWTEDLDGILFGIHELKKKEKKEGEGEEKEDAPQAGPAARRNAKEPEEEKADLVIWHWLDKRLQPQQEVEENRDKNFSYLCIYRVAEKKFFRLADDDMRRVDAAPDRSFAVGIDDSKYQLEGSLDGRRYQDVYAVDLSTGQRKLAIEKVRWFFGPSPAGNEFLYYRDGQYSVYDAATGRSKVITADVPTSFVNTEDDHNVVKPPVRPVGWVKDGKSVLLSDNWDVWNVPVDGGKAVNLTVNGKKEGIRYQRRFVLDPEEKGIDLSGAVYFSTLDEATKKGGIARIDGGRPGARRLLLGDALFSSLIKAKDAGVYLYTRETYADNPDYYAADDSLQNGAKITGLNPQQKDFLWSAGSKLINYTSDKGDKLQAALFLPADYEPGKIYPTVVYIYEKLTSGLNRYYTPTANGFNKSVYTSNGYAVLMPDIVYKVNDPGMSAVWCVVPAVKAAIATGVVDKDHIAIHGHSWGGYQTAFLITQTNIFAAAIAGAPLTNMISMYSSVYWNTGSANQPIFESSQGRFSGGPWELLDAYTRNSPVYYAQNIKTPLLLLHNDKDGAVDWNQGVTYFNTIRRMRKPVVMLQYKGENHGLAKPANQQDYTVRMKEFLDHYLKGKPAPEWWKKGIPYLKLEKEVERTAEKEKKTVTK